MRSNFLYGFDGPTGTAEQLIMCCYDYQDQIQPPQKSDMNVSSSIKMHLNM